MKGNHHDSCRRHLRTDSGAKRSEPSLRLVSDDPTMPDYEYDQKLRRLEMLEAEHPELAADGFSHQAGRGRGCCGLCVCTASCSLGELAGCILL